MPIIASSSLSSGVTLQDYLSVTQRLLHDPNENFFPVADLIGYINEARAHTALDTQALRKVVTYNTAAGTANYDAQVVLASSGLANTVMAIVDIFAIWSTERYKLRNMAYTRLNRETRPWTIYQTWMIGWARLGQTGVIVGPTPDQAYSTEWDLIYAPVDLTAPSDSENELLYPQTEPVPYYAAYLARMYEEDSARAQQMMSLYRGRISESQANFVTLNDEYEEDMEGF
ncbi:MAG: hypothetical protein ACRD52_00715 [Candidatus Acidiferrales bacterium]